MDYHASLGDEMFSANRPKAGAPRAHELWMATFAYQGHEDQTLGLAAASAPTMGGCDMAQRTQTRPRAHWAWGSGSTSRGEFSLKLCFFELSFKSLRRELASNTLADRSQKGATKSFLCRPPSVMHARAARFAPAVPHLARIIPRTAYCMPSSGRPRTIRGLRP